ncbi:MAG: hypothetical protein H6691_05985 [Gemmatimonadales bacterium]|nr:hypothetical protein [Gemmatimonadales bacterium]
MRPSRLLPILVLTTSLACGTSSPGPTGSGDPSDPRVGLPSSYALQVGSYTLTGNSGVDTRWNDNDGLLYLGADDVAEPLGTVTMQLGPVSTGTNGSRTATVQTAVVSATRVRVGTAAELGAVLYRLPSGTFAQITGIRTGVDYIEGTMSIPLEQVSPAPQNGAPPAVATLTGTFRASNR